LALAPVVPSALTLMWKVSPFAGSFTGVGSAAPAAPVSAGR
jgi:hypothetical protein